MDISDVKALVDASDERIKKQIGEAQAANQKALQDVLEAANKTKAEKDAEIAKINSEFTELRKAYVEIEKKAGRPAATGDGKSVILTPDQQEHKRLFTQFLRKGEDSGLREIERKAMNSQSDPDGGYLVLPEIDQAIDRFAPTMAAVYRLANVVQIGGNQYQKRVKTSGMSMRRVAEGGTGGETTEPKFANLVIEAFPAEVEPWVNNETLADSFFDLEGDLASEAAIGFFEGAGSEFITGNGVGKARGITSYTNVANASYSWGNVGYIASGASGAFAASNPGDKLIDLNHALKAQYRPGAVWLMSDATLGVARQMKDGSGQYYLWQPDPLATFGGRLLGFPVEIDDNMPAMAANSYSIAFANFKRAYTIVQRAGTALIRDNITSKGVTKFNFRRRFGGGITHFEAIKLMKFA